MSYIALANTTLPSGATSVTFSSIPTSVNGVALRDLVVVINAGRNNGGDMPYLRFNGDTGANYTWVNMFGRSSAGSETQGSRTSFIALGSQAFLWDRFDYVSITQIMDFSANDKHKTALVRANRGSGADTGVEAVAGRWSNNTVINSVTIANFGNAIAGSTVSLYGIAG